MTVDLSNIVYSVVAVLSDGTQVHLTKAASNIGWEENDKELAVRLNLTISDVQFGNKRLAAVLSLCTVIYLYANYGIGDVEIWRGTIWEWEYSQINDSDIVVTCYDQLYYLQKSQDNKYYAKGKGTKTIITDILTSWSVPIGTYAGPDVKHAKILYKNKTISSMIIETLDDAKKLGGGKSLVRSSKGKAEIVKYGANEDVFVFSADHNLVMSSDKYSMVDLVTRVVIVGKEDKNGKPKVQATLNGKTEYGILQQIHSRGDSSLSEAKKEAQEILDEKGSPKRTTTLRSPDLPFLRKGDKIYVETDSMTGYFFVKGVSHSATNGQMNMEVEPV